VTSAGRGRGLEFRRYEGGTEQGLRDSQENLRDPVDPSRRWFIGAHLAKREGTTVSFPISLQNGDPTSFSPRPVEMWVEVTPKTASGVAVSQYIDEFGKETFSPDGYKDLPEWSPIFLEKGELTFDTGGNLVSPKQGSQLDTVYLPDGKGALTININYSKSTQFSSPYAVLSQSQDGAPEGDLVGLSMADDGLVNASYSNGSQKSLGKVVLVNFTNPTGLRQIGDTSYYKSASSGTPKYGEAGSAGFGTVRSGATERANVDLTQELVDLITEQRNFQANAKAIETSTTMTQSIIQIRA